MHCKNCDYPLWNIPTRQCPECGTSFLPGEYEFVRNSVQFCCPHCEQVYYGTDAKGHLSPLEFDCVSCGEHLHMDGMLLRPAEGVEERQTRATPMPWLERKERGWFKAWMATIGMALGQPGKLMKIVPAESTSGQAWGFAALTISVVAIVSTLPGLCVFLLVPSMSAPGAGGPPPGTLMAAMGGMLGMSLALSFGLAVIHLLIWGLVTHGLLKIFARPAAGLGRTYQGLCYASGAYSLTVVPCLGPYVGWIWWIISGVLAVRDGQGVTGGRAALAVLTWPVAEIILIIGFYATIITMMFVGMPPGSMAASGGMDATQETQQLSQDLISNAAANNGCGPDHVVEMVPTSNLGAISFVSWDTATSEADVILPDGTLLLDLQRMPPNRQRMKIDEIVASLPEDVIAHRMGDFLFTHHGIDFDSADSGLWIVLYSPDPDVNGPWVAPTIVAGCLDGSTQQIPISTLNSALQQQNMLRNSHALPPLPDPATITHDNPAVAK
ncbi:MAG: hypothetical protein JSV91_09050 [Phycisphaerales bacterium]|nr:MAG: hypothetical protein JSV91_09050 [Phycisphaerales bacterium]